MKNKGTNLEKLAEVLSEKRGQTIDDFLNLHLLPLLPPELQEKHPFKSESDQEEVNDWVDNHGLSVRHQGDWIFLLKDDHKIASLYIEVYL